MNLLMSVVLLSSGCHKKTPQTGWLKQQETTSHSSGERGALIPGDGQFDSPVFFLPFRLFLESLHDRERREIEGPKKAAACLLIRVLIPSRGPYSPQLPCT